MNWKSEYQIERIAKNKLRDLLPLYKDAFAKNVSEEHFIKKFDTACFGAEYIGFIAYDRKGEPAAYYGLFPCVVTYVQKNIPAATSGDTMTHSKHRGKGLFVELAKRTYQLAKESGIKLAYGFPNQNSLQGSVNLGWQYLGDQLKSYTVNIKTIPVSKLVRKLNLIKTVSKPIGVSDQFSNSLSEKNNGAVLHDADYFKYKIGPAKRVITIAGAKAWCKSDGVLKIGDVERIEKLDIRQFLDELRSYAFKHGITEIQFLVSNDTWLDKELSPHLEGKYVFPVGHFIFDAKGIDLTKIKYGMCDLDTF